MKILLVNPEWHYILPDFIPDIPLGLGIIAAVLRSHGYKVEILDINGLGLNKKEVEVEVKERSFDIVGMPVFIGDLQYIRWFTEVVSRHKPGASIILGGPLVTTAPVTIMRYMVTADVAVIGEGEETTIDLLEALRKGEDLKKVRGIVYKDKTSGELHFTTPKIPVYDLDAVPLPAWDLFPVGKYIKEGKKKEANFRIPYLATLPHMTLMTSRGCPFRCAFCAVPTMFPTMRYRSVENVAEELKILRKTYGIKAVWFRDDTFTANRRRTTELCKVMSEIGLLWGCTTRAHLLEPELLARMKESGCILIRLGIESLTQEVLDISQKGGRVEQSFQAIRWIKEAEIQVQAFFLLGLPGETRNTIERIIDFAKQTKITPIPYILLPLPGSPLYQEARRTGKILSEEEYILRLGETTPFEVLINLTNLPDEFLIEAMKTLTALKVNE